MPYYIKRTPKKKKEKPLPLFDKAGINVKKKPDLVAKLDKVFSRYIRLRDCMPNGYFRCISCGQIKPFEQADCGHFHSRRHMATRFDEDNAHAECRHCLTPDSLILMKDFTWKQLGDIKVGEEVFAFDEEIIYKTSRRYRIGKVISVERDIQDVYEVELENGDKIKTTANHKWLTRDKISSAYKWCETQNMWINGVNLHGKHKSGPHTNHITTTVCKPFQVVLQDMSYESGWIAGMIDADGHVCQQKIKNPDGTLRYGFRVGIAQCEKYMDICDKIKVLLEKFTGNKKTCRQTMESCDRRGIFKKQHQTWQFLITGTNVEKLQFLMRVRPFKIQKVDIEKLGKLKSQYDTKVKSITYLGKMEIVAMETDTHTYIANGYAMHNCNRFSADHLIQYEKNLKAKIGQMRFAKLAWKARQTRKWTDFELIELTKYYKALGDKLSKEKGL